MTIIEVLDHVRELLRSKGRITYRMLQMQFALSEVALTALKEELIEAERVAVDENGKVLVWAGSLASSIQSLESKTANPPDARRPTLDPRPASYTPPHLAERIRAEQVALEARGSVDGERKTITALFANLKGSTALIEGLDPEEARALIDPALQLMMDAVHRYEGYVAQALGDGIFALFGAPIAHEDHPHRALYAALRMQEEMHRYADRLREQGYPPLLMRVGVNTGEVVVRSIRKEDLHTDYVPVGHSTNLAARMEQLAAPGSILVTEQTHKLTTGYFEFKAMGKTQVKGVEEPLHVYEVLGVGPLRTRLQVAARRGLSRFVGRHSELEQLLAVAHDTHDPLLLLYAHDVLGIALYWLGEFAPARLHLEQSLALYDPQHHHSLVTLHGGADPGVRCRSYLATTLWALGAVDQARQRIHAALTLARELAHPYSLQFALTWAALLSQLQRESVAAQERAEAAMTLVTEQGFAQLLAFAMGFRGWALAEQGQGEQGIAQMCQAHAAFQATGAGEPLSLAGLAEAYGKVGQPEEGLAVVAAALAAVPKGRRAFAAELYRLKGELVLWQHSLQASAGNEKVPLLQLLPVSLKRNGNELLGVLALKATLR